VSIPDSIIVNFLGVNGARPARFQKIEVIYLFIKFCNPCSYLAIPGFLFNPPKRISNWLLETKRGHYFDQFEGRYKNLAAWVIAPKPYMAKCGYWQKKNALRDRLWRNLYACELLAVIYPKWGARWAAHPFCRTWPCNMEICDYS